MVFLFQCRLGPRGVLIHRLIITEDVRGVIDGNTEHSEFVPKRFSQLYGILHRLEFTPESARFDSVLAFTMPYDRCLVTKQEYTGL